MTHLPPPRAYLHAMIRAGPNGLEVVGVSIFSDETPEGTKGAYACIAKGYGDTYEEAQAHIMQQVDQWYPWLKPFISRQGLRSCEHCGQQLLKNQRCPCKDDKSYPIGGDDD